MILPLIMTLLWCSGILVAWSLCRAAHRGDALWTQYSPHEKDPV